MAETIKVMVSGCFDLLHAGHIAFLNEAATYGKLHVYIGSDDNIMLLKGKPSYFSQKERLYILENIKSVFEVKVASGTGILDFKPDLIELKPDIFVVNSDGHTPEKEALCRKYQVDYKVLERIPAKDLPARASSTIKKEMAFPYRVALSGGWMDQPWISKICDGSMVVVSIEPTIYFAERSGMATSSRKAAIKLWNNRVPVGNPIENARLLFGAENPPDSEYVSGSQDHIGLLVPGISRLYYNGGYWPAKIDTVIDKETVEWLENVLYMVPYKPRPDNYNPLRIQNISEEWVRRLGQSGELCWQSILNHDVKGLGQSFKDCVEAWHQLLPLTVLDESWEILEKYKEHAGAFFSGSGGGYVIVASDKPVVDGFKIKVRVM